MFPSRLNRSGFTLLEAIIALMIFLVGILATLQFFPNSAKLIIAARHNTQASFLLQEKIEEYLAKPYAELETGVVEPRTRIVSDTTSQLSIFETEVRIDHLDGDFEVVMEDEGIKKINVTIYWPEGKTTKTQSLTTITSRY